MGNETNKPTCERCGGPCLENERLCAACQDHCRRKDAPPEQDAELATLRARVAELENIVALSGQPVPDVRTVSTSDGLPERDGALARLGTIAELLDGGCHDGGCEYGLQHVQQAHRIATGGDAPRRTMADPLVQAKEDQITTLTRDLDAQRHAAADAVEDARLARLMSTGLILRAEKAEGERDDAVRAATEARVGAKLLAREARQIIADRDAEIARLRRRMDVLTFLSTDDDTLPDAAVQFLANLPPMQLGADVGAFLDATADALERAGLMPATEAAKEETR